MKSAAMTKGVVTFTLSPAPPLSLSRDPHIENRSSRLKVPAGTRGYLRYQYSAITPRAVDLP